MPEAWSLSWTTESAVGTRPAPPIAMPLHLWPNNKFDAFTIHDDMMILSLCIWGVNVMCWALWFLPWSESLAICVEQAPGGKNYKAQFCWPQRGKTFSLWSCYFLLSFTFPAFFLIVMPQNKFQQFQFSFAPIFGPSKKFLCWPWGDDTRQNRPVEFRQTDKFLACWEMLRFERAPRARNVPFDPRPFGSCGFTASRANGSLSRGRTWQDMERNLNETQRQRTVHRATGHRWLQSSLDLGVSSWNTKRHKRCMKHSFVPQNEQVPCCSNMATYGYWETRLWSFRALEANRNTDNYKEET